MKQQTIPPTSPSRWSKFATLFPLYALIGIECLAFALLIPMLSIITTEYFAKKFNHGEFIDCVINADTKICQEGSGKANVYASLSSSIGSLVMFFLSPLLGKWSDAYGRKPFLVLSQIVNLALPISIVMFYEMNHSIFMFYAVSLLIAAYSTFSIAIASVADMTLPEERTSAFAALMAVASLGYILSALASTHLSKNDILQYVSILYVTRIIWSIFILSETLPVAKRQPLDWDEDHHSVFNPFQSMKILLRSRLFQKLSLLISVTALISAGIDSLMAFYLNSHFHFDKNDIATYLVVSGSSAFLMQTVCANILISWLRERGVIILTLWVMLLGYFTLSISAIFPSRIIIFIYASISGLSSLTFPAIASLKSIHCTEQEQGQIQGAIYSIRGLAGSIGPLVYSFMYSESEEATFVYDKTIPFVVSMVLNGVAIYIAQSLPESSPTTLRSTGESIENESLKERFLPPDDEEKEVEV